MAKIDKRPGPPKTGAPTIHDVARVACVVGPVSRALTNPKLVAARTRDRVAEAARQLGYLHLPAPHRQESRTVLALIPRLGSPFFTAFLDAATDLLSESGYCVVVGDLRGSTRKEGLYAQALREGRFAGAILFTGSFPGGDRSALRLPIVLACNDIPDAEDCPFSTLPTARLPVRSSPTLSASGIGGSRISEALAQHRGRRTRAGFLEAMAAAGLQADPGPGLGRRFLSGSGVAAAGRFLACAERPTAVFAGNDQMAMGFITEMKAAGVSVPEHVSVAGFDDIEYSSIFDPALTTMRQPKAEIGDWLRSNCCAS